VRGLGAGGKPERDEQAVLIRGLGLDETEAAVGDEDAGDEESTDHR
jgi:hypothetical protein